MVTKIGRDSFQGLSKLYGKGGLGAAIRGLAIDLAVTRAAAIATNTLVLTDSTTGVVGARIADLVLPTRFDASTAGGAPVTGLNTAFGALESGARVIGESLNLVRAKLGLPALTFAAGTGGSLTVPAQTKTVTAAAGTSAASYASALAAFKAAKTTQRRLAAAVHETIAALGGTPAHSDLAGEHTSGVALVDIPNVVAAPASPNSISVSKVQADAFLTASANNLAKLAAEWNARVNGLATTPLNVVGK